MCRASRWRRILSVALALISPVSGCASDPSSSGYIMYYEYAHQYRFVNTDDPLAILCWYTGDSSAAKEDTDRMDASLWYSLLWRESGLSVRDSIAEEQRECPCPLDVMSHIFQVYSEVQRENARIYVIHYPVTYADLVYSEESAIEDSETYAFLYETMELEIPDYLE